MVIGLAPKPRNKIRSMYLFSILLVGIIILSYQYPAAFAGVECGKSDPDCDRVFTNDNCPRAYNPNQEDSNGDGIGDACDPVPAILDVIQEVEDLIESGEFDTDSNEAQSLLTKLNNAIDKIESQDVNAAKGLLKAFINQIKAYINSGALSAEEGQELIDEVQNILLNFP